MTTADSRVGRRVRDPQGTKWTVRRRWLAWRPRISLGDAIKVLLTGVPGGNPISDAINLILLVLALPVVVIAAVEHLILVVLLPFVALPRACGVLSWPVDVRRKGAFVCGMAVPGYAAAGRVRATIARHIQAGGLPTDPNVAAWLAAAGATKPLQLGRAVVAA